jgi:L-alanine-DL-glutamate epimerase-like enolase superfamily enzyme
MIIKEIRTHTFGIPLLKTFKTALRSIDRIENLVVVIRTDTDLLGIGSAAPTAVITGDTLEAIEGAILHLGRMLVGENVLNYEAVLQKLNAGLVGNTSAKAAIDMAIYDILGKYYQVPVYKLLGGYRNQLETDYTISLDSPEKMIEESQTMVAQGFSILKTKVGKNIAEDIKRLVGIRKTVGESITLRIDANQGWRAKEAANAVNRLQAEGIDLELVEQPVKRSDFEGLKYVKDRITIPLVADESVFSPRDALQLMRMNAVDGINIKLMKSGGIFQALKIASLAETNDIDCMVGSMMEGPIGVTAAAHLAAAKAVITRIDLDAALFCAPNPIQGGIRYDGSRILLPDTPGLGIENPEELLRV